MARKSYAKQKKAKRRRELLGPSGRPGEVTVKSLDTGEIVGKIEPVRLASLRMFRQGAFAPKLHAKAREAGFESYAHFLASDHWAGMRQRVLERDAGSCTRCPSKVRLQVHHLTYKRLGRERMEDLTMLCRACHREAHMTPSQRAASTQGT